MRLRFRQLNWHMLALHLASVPPLVLGMLELFLIQHIWLMRLILRYGPEAYQHLPAGYSAAQMVTELESRDSLANLAALLVACVLSGLVVWHRRESRWLPALVFGGGVLLSWSHWQELPLLRSLRLALRGPMDAAGIEYRMAAIGVLLLLLGLLPFLFTWRKPVPAPAAAR